MTEDAEREARWGIQHNYTAFDGSQRASPRSSVDAVLQSMGATDGEPPGSGPLVVRSGARIDVSGDFVVHAEDGETWDGNAEELRRLPTGYHRLVGEEGERALIVAPPLCPQPWTENLWGWALQLYSLRANKSWGIGDFHALAEFSRLASDHGAGMALLSPLHASIPGVPQEPSPYYPSSRSFLDPLYIAVPNVPGAESLGAALVEAAHAGAALNSHRHIDRDEIWALKMRVLRQVRSARPRHDEVSAYLRRSQPDLQMYATFCALATEHGMDWREWPRRYRHPRNEEVARFAAVNEDEVRFHAWLQLTAEEQLTQAAGNMSLMQDLAIGVDPAGADAWLWQDTFALGMRVGAPPDEFNTRGQNWSLPPFDPWRLRSVGHQPLIATLRAAFAHSAALRVDHVMGLFRLYWIPVDAPASDGVYVRYPHDELLAILALEAERAKSFVVGEDLGTVDQYMRDALTENQILSYKLLWFEDAEPVHYPKRSMAAVTTHDLPTIAGVVDGRDLEVQQQLDLQPNEESFQRLKDKVHQWSEGRDPRLAVHERLASASSEVVTATLEDALGQAERPNYPGTVDEWPNWSVALPTKVEELASHEGFTAVSGVMRAARGTQGGVNEAS